MIQHQEQIEPQTHPFQADSFGDRKQAGTMEVGMPATATTLQTPVQIASQAYADELMAIVQVEARKFRNSRALSRGVSTTFGILIGLLVVVFITRGILHGKWDFDLIGSFASMTGIVGIAAASTNMHKTAASQLAALGEGDVRAIGPLAESLDIEDKNVREVIEMALVRLLPNLQASDATRFSAEQRACLNRALNGRNEALILAILRAYEQIGNEGALPYVKRLASETPNARHSVEITEAARACLPYLRDRVAQQRASEQLLRASSVASAPTDTLLRPVEYRPDADSQSLLRAGTLDKTG